MLDKRIRWLMLVVSGVFGLVSWTATPIASAESGGSTSLVGTQSDGSLFSDGTAGTLISGNDRYVVFQTDASGGSSPTLLYRKDLQTGQIAQVDTNSDGVSANAPTNSFDGISSDGRYVLFDSTATNLVSGDTNGFQDVFVKDMQTGQVERVNVSTSGAQANQTSSAEGVTPDGKYVVFSSTASNLISGDTSTRRKIYRHDTVTGETILVSTNAAGQQANNNSSGSSVSSDGQLVSFQSSASNLVSDSKTNSFVMDIYFKNLGDGSITRVDKTTTGGWPSQGADSAMISADGGTVVFESNDVSLVANDTNGKTDIFAYAVQTGNITRASISSGGAEGDGASQLPAVNGSGRYIAYTSAADNLVANDTNAQSDAFVHDQSTGVTYRVNLDSQGGQASKSVLPSVGISADGTFVAFNTAASLATGDTNNTYDMYLRHMSALTAIGYFTTNNGSTFSRQTVPYTSGVATQAINSDGSVTVSVNSAPGYADSGFVLYKGALGNLPDFTINGSGGGFGLNLWFDSDANGEFFQWDANNVLTGLGGDTYGLSGGSSNGTLSVNGSSQFFMMNDGQNHSLADLKNGSVSGISTNTVVTVWIGVDISNGGSTSATISSIVGL
jgi:hypothetical protein